MTSLKDDVDDTTMTTDKHIVNRKEDLRPIGSEYFYTFRPTMNVPYATRIRYRVVKHSLVQPGINPAVLHWAETVESVGESVKIPAALTISMDGRWIYEWDGGPILCPHCHGVGHEPWNPIEEPDDAPTT